MNENREEDLYLTQDDDEDETMSPLVDGWVCDDDGKAEWCLKQIRDAEDTIKRWEEHYAQQLDRIRKAQQRRIDTMTVYLRRYLLMQRDAGMVKSTKTQDSYGLPSGTLRLKHGGVEYKRDDDKLVAWLQDTELDALIKVKLSPDWAGLKKLVSAQADGNVVLTETGEIISGVTAVQKQDSFVIERKGE